MCIIFPDCHSRLHRIISVDMLYLMYLRAPRFLFIQPPLNKSTAFFLFSQSLFWVADGNVSVQKLRPVPCDIPVLNMKNVAQFTLSDFLIFCLYV